MVDENNEGVSVNSCALILGGYVNGYSIISELYDEGVKNIWLFEYNKSLASYSNKISGFSRLQKDKVSLLENILKLREVFDYIVCFPTDDLQIELLYEIKDEISEFCFLPFNDQNIYESIDKSIQYDYCEKLNIPYPKTLDIREIDDLTKINNLNFPIIVKPNTRADINTSVFRNLYLKDKNAFENKMIYLEKFIKQGVGFLFSEYIPGDDTVIYAYTAYRSKKGEILNEWIGKKLTQYPDNYGVFSSASNEAPEEVLIQGRKLLECMNIYGIAEPEFKYDYRDNKYKLMEINLRSMMWNRLGNLTGVKLMYTQWNDANNDEIIKYTQNLEKKIHFIYLKHEILNLISRKGYYNFFRSNIYGGDENYFAVYDKDDIKPFIFDLLKYPKGAIYVCLKALRLK